LNYAQKTLDTKNSDVSPHGLSVSHIFCWTRGVR